MNLAVTAIPKDPCFSGRVWPLAVLLLVGAIFALR